MPQASELDSRFNELPPRTWRGWWLAWPKWFRIGAYAFAGFAVLHIALAVRIYVGLIEPREMRELRERSVQIEYFWRNQREWFPHYLTLIAGLYGKSWSNVQFISGYQLRADDLRTIRLNCPSLPWLSLDDVTPEILAELVQFRQLEGLNLSNTDIEDEAVLKMATLKNLNTLRLSETLITDDALGIIEHLPRLENLYVEGTEVTESAWEFWRARRESLLISANIDMVFGVIRWRATELALREFLADTDIAQSGQNRASRHSFTPLAKD